MILPGSVLAQAPETSENTALSLRGNHLIEVRAGLLSEVGVKNEVTVAEVTSKSDLSGLLGSVAYTYYFDHDFGIITSIGLLDADASSSVIGLNTIVESASVMHWLFGVKYQPSKLSLGESLRPYASLSVGPYIGTASNVRGGFTASTESFTETALGSRLAVGIDVFLGRFIALGVGAGYHLVSDFNNRIGSEKNYSSPEFSLSFGVRLGG
jgi:hypothetical protein